MSKLRASTFVMLLGALLAAPHGAAAMPEGDGTATAAAKAGLSLAIDEVLLVLRNSNSDTNGKLDRLQEITDRRFNFPRMSKLVLGRNRRKLSDEQQVEFEREFRRHLTVTYGQRIESFAGEEIEIGAARLERNGEVTVKTKLVGGSADGILIDYRLREREGSWQIIDVIIEGVSLVQNFRAQIQEIVSSKGADQLIVVLREKNNPGGGTGSN
ncbi:MAG: ABC transporter substrate-binding protein [Myxococcota bacterium]|jgi:phospholipid transport system substrate-binding protein